MESSHLTKRTKEKFLAPKKRSESALEGFGGGALFRDERTEHSKAITLIKREGCVKRSEVPAHPKTGGERT